MQSTIARNTISHARHHLIKHSLLQQRKVWSTSIDNCNAWGSIGVIFPSTLLPRFFFRRHAASLQAGKVLEFSAMFYITTFGAHCWLYTLLLPTTFCSVISNLEYLLWNIATSTFTLLRNYFSSEHFSASNFYLLRIPCHRFNSLYASR